MRNCLMDTIEEYDDINTKDQYRTALEAGCTEKEALDACFRYSRDNARTPMQWSCEKEAGFTTGKPWLKVNRNYTEINVEDQLKDEDSVLHFYKKLIALRKSEAYREILTYGRFVPAFETNEDIFAFFRENENGERIFVAANFGKDEKTLKLPEKNYTVLLTNDDSASDGTLSTLEADGTLCLKSCGVTVIREEA